MLVVAANYPKEISFQSGKTRRQVLTDAKIDAKTSRVYHVIDYGADPTGKIDATDAIMRAISDVFTPMSESDLLAGIRTWVALRFTLTEDLICFLLRSGYHLPGAIHGGGESLHASIEFPTDRYLIELSSSSQSQSPSHQNYEYITIRDVMLDGNYRSGGIAVVNSLRTSLDNLYIVHFSSDGIFVKGGHEIYVRNSYLGQHITAGGDPREREILQEPVSISPATTTS
ncbi:hypothetical protein ZOSMA_69G00510 [Zostera marina]|uniref:Uncharacterized protein n=1 Tax=Zostera marina TaxID=29655 RepID=A0A0K9NRX7_ZOSMR|nr:hypothetical protein ZOSMA_69G00510 [Zostera marina]